ncbi:Uncharacterised protein [Serratia quinivorans]|uniref:hypothetical protein n=1 Tax=Serratia quinivorans TaxID=137545 RepID=UPI00217820E9|nr:hypothetical protein [Serratia quinivorans]CAI1769788.1 Uncharacterised protein [Serratia quinivorans]
MPLESAQYINTLQPDWPLGSDPESAGDDHLRMIKQVLQNTFPSVTAAVTTTAEHLNNVTDGLVYTTATTDPIAAATWKLVDPGDESKTNRIGLAGIAAPTAGDQAVPMDYITNIMQNMIYTVGSLWTGSGNPADVLGFGTWVNVIGTLYGAGVSTDGGGLQLGLSPGAQSGDWLIDQSAIRAFNITAYGTTGAAGAHSHEGGWGAPGAVWGGAETGTDNSSWRNFSWTSTDGNHTHDFNTTFTVGQGANPHNQPGYAIYAWVRTA